MKLKKGDFIQIDYVGRIKDTKQIFDLTDEELAKKEGIHQENAKYKPIVICIGEGDIVKGLDEELVDKEVGKSYTLEISPEKGFGKKDAKLIKLVNTNMFLKQNINPMPGLQVNIDNMIATIRTVTGGRTLVDFNHPLAGRDLTYEVKILKKITEDKEKLESILSFHLGIEKPDIKIENGIALINNDVKDTFKKQLEEKIKKLIPSIKKIEYKKKEEEKKKEEKEETKKEEKKETSKP
ncbi:MAG: peptidylprolyl isomerase [Nanoarchaeota archaeon]|nr:peptidylprolyl isomerase [Nanoarchaeota archaeon]